MFVENVGQFEDEALFQVRGAEGAIHLTSDGFWLTLMEEPPALSPEDGQTAGILTAPETSLRGVHLRLSFPSANPQPKVMGFDPIDTTISYFRGNDPAQWHSGVPVWRGVRYIDLYPGVDLEMTSEAGAWSWQFVTSEQSLELIEGSLPRGNAADGREAAGLRLQIEGSEGLTIDAGRVHIANAILQIALPLPDLIRAGNLTSLINKVGTVLEGEEVFLPLIDLSTQPEPILTASERPMAEPPQLDKPAVIPEDTAIPVSASTLGGGGGFQAQVTPFTDPEIRNAAGLRDVRLNGIDDLLYSTFLGDNEHDNGNDVEFGEDGTMFLVGTTRNWDFPIIPGAVDIIFQGNNEAFVSKVDPTAFGSPSLVYSTFLGGEISDAGYGIAVSPSGDGTVYIVGNTSSSDFPTTEGAFSETLKGLDDIFVARLAAGGDELLYSTYLGGTNDEVGRPDWGFGIAVDPEGSGIAYVTGSTFATDFPTLGAYQDEYGGGVSDGYVTALNSTGTELVYSTYLGGASSEEIRGIAMSPGGGGDVFLTGRYAGPDFPTTIGAFRTTHTSQYGEAFAVRLNAAGNDLVYSTFLGGSYKTEAYSIAVDSLDNAYITGQTWSDDFPITFGAYQTALLGPFDAFVFKLNPGGTAPVWSTYLGGGPGYTVGDHVERGYDIIVDVNGFPTVTGHSTSGATFPTTTGAFSTSGQIFLTRMTSDGAELSYSAVFGAIDYGYGVGQRPDGSGVVAVTGVTWGGIPITSNAYDTTYNGGGDAFVSVVDMGFTGSAIPDNAVHSGCGDDTDGRGCAVANASNATGEAVDPINTRTGGLDYPVVDISLPTIAGLLVFQRSYASLATDMYTTLLGYGWSHNHETRLVFPDDPGGEAGKVIFKAHSANQYEIIDNGDGTYSAGPGVLVTLTLDSGPPPTYTLTDFTQNTYLFDEDGKLLTWTNASGHSWSYTYDASDRLDIVVDDTSGRYLDLAYDLQERLESVSDNTGREVSFTYDGNGDLTNVNDVEGENWTYVYDTAHRLTDVIDPRLVPVMHTDYDAEGRAYQQFDGEGNRQALITYNPDGTTSIEDALTNIEVHTYDARNTLTSETDALGNDLGKNYDYHFRPSTITDKNENPVTLLWSTDGANLEQVVDAVGNDVNMDYDVLNNLTQIVDARDFPTDFEYVGAQLTKVIDPYLKETIYTYTTVADAPQPIGLLKTIRDPNLNVTEYEYDAEGNLIHITDEIPGDTTYTYDALGRLQTTTDRLGIVDWTCYDSAGRLTRTVSNASGDGGSPQTDPCDAASYIPSSAPDVDRITSIVYDEVGNPLASIDPAGTITRTYYDDNNRPAVVVQNLVGQTIENPTPPTYNPSNPDKNIRTEIVYDVAGNPIATIDTLGRITRTYYDELNRPQYVVENLVGQGISVTTPPAYNPIYPDQNIRSETVYDDNSNVIASINTLGRITRTYYNSLNQVEYVVGNLVGQAISVPTPPSYSPSNPDQNIRTEYIYDVSGNTIASIDTLGQITRTYYDALNRPESIVQNLTGQAISVETPP
jgi:YD repeat-containing protein